MLKILKTYLHRPKSDRSTLRRKGMTTSSSKTRESSVLDSSMRLTRIVVVPDDTKAKSKYPNIVEGEKKICGNATISIFRGEKSAS